MRYFANRIVAFGILFGAAAVAGCSQKPAPAPAVPMVPPISTTQTTSHFVSRPQSGLNVSGEILKACEIDFNNVDTAPKFDFDESNLRLDERDLLQRVAKCLTTGPLRGRSLRLVGRADPRGELEYNFALGGARGASVSSYLVGLGVEPSKVSTTSRGELDAIGRDEAGWQRDRRVDVDLQ